MTHLSWVVTAFMLTSTTTTPLYGKLSDIYGRRTLFFVAILMFLAGSLLCGAAQSMGQIDRVPRLAGAGRGRPAGAGAGGDRRRGLAARAAALPGSVHRHLRAVQRRRARCSAASSPRRCRGAGCSTSTCRSASLALVMIAIGLRKPPSGKVRPIDYAGALLLAGSRPRRCCCCSRGAAPSSRGCRSTDHRSRSLLTS